MKITFGKTTRKKPDHHFITYVDGNEVATIERVWPEEGEPYFQTRAGSLQEGLEDYGMDRKWHKWSNVAKNKEIKEALHQAVKDGWRPSWADENWGSKETKATEETEEATEETGETEEAAEAAEETGETEEAQE